jgi:hypothetical protein
MMNNGSYTPYKIPYCRLSLPPQPVSAPSREPGFVPFPRQSEVITFCNWLAKADQNISRLMNGEIPHAAPDNYLENLIQKRTDLLSDLEAIGVSEAEAYRFIDQRKSRARTPIPEPEFPDMNLSLLERKDPFNPNDLINDLGGPYYGPGPELP